MITQLINNNYIFIYKPNTMRRFDKKYNMQKANILAEQRYLQSKGLLKEDDNVELDAPVAEPEVAEPQKDSNEKPAGDVPTTPDGEFGVRFNLNFIHSDPITKHKIAFTWKIELNGSSKYIPIGDDKLNFNPNNLVDKVPYGGVRNNFDTKTFNIDMFNCILDNNQTRAFSIFNGKDKEPIAFVKCGDIKINYGSGSPGSNEVMYNPRVAPYWRMKSSNDPFSNATGDAILISDVNMNYEEGVVYKSEITAVTKGKEHLYDSRYFLMNVGGNIYIKEVRAGENEDNYKVKEHVYLGVDGKQFSKLTTSGGKIYAG